ncbi:hypothetical protein N665_0254s0006 [Sinapis alba]|nr:hypothetical protein N665_0254s0006 [Sinapis alba]
MRGEQQGSCSSTTRFDRVNRVDSLSRLGRVGRVTGESPATVTGRRRRGRRRLTGKLTGGDGGARRSGGGAAAETISGGGACNARACSAKLPEARAGSSELRLRRGRWLRLRLDERNIMVALHARDSQWLGSCERFTKTAETKLYGMAVSGLPLWFRTVTMSVTTSRSAVVPAASPGG